MRVKESYKRVQRSLARARSDGIREIPKAVSQALSTVSRASRRLNTTGSEPAGEPPSPQRGDPSPSHGEERPERGEEEDGVDLQAGMMTLGGMAGDGLPGLGNVKIATLMMRSWMTFRITWPGLTLRLKRQKCYLRKS